MTKVFEWFGGRKLFFAMVLFVIATIVFLFSDKTDFEGWKELVMWIFGIYAGGNVGEHISTGIKPEVKPKK